MVLERCASRYRLGLAVLAAHPEKGGGRFRSAARYQSLQRHVPASFAANSYGKQKQHRQSKQRVPVIQERSRIFIIGKLGSDASEPQQFQRWRSGTEAWQQNVRAERKRAGGFIVRERAKRVPKRERRPLAICARTTHARICGVRRQRVECIRRPGGKRRELLNRWRSGPFIVREPAQRVSKLQVVGLSTCVGQV